ncbi:hypothetical protein HH310_08345 [Actinoplanes sp. TBRC 11911]|uniref:hypothetical protein n=1 Tax=Actinoplanes sp. TBRC 11911 TaxID=2729386 RepID=UPI00145E9C4A|nr:hypothetical protein [Actinoplanes sp. TBRC 11911]NMO51196.1 hypothetical protein [Actinoplanes sp. TBRC 11911]
MTPLRRAVAAVAALVVAGTLTVVDPFAATRPASAAIDPISGFGTTDSAVTVHWADGLTGTDNKTIVTPRQPKGSSGAFLDDLWDGFGNLSLTVGQTSGLTHQSVQVSWSGATPTPPGNISGDYLQMMQCYGDSEKGPDPENCQWGSFNAVSLPDAASSGVKVDDSRTGVLCGDNPASPSGCDPAEKDHPEHVPPAVLNQSGIYSVPFIPVDTTDKIYLRDADSLHPDLPSLSEYFNAQSTNEIPAGITSADGTGEEHFEVQTNREAGGLGCGAPNAAAGNSPRSCWLVVVPRGNVHPNNQPQRLGNQSALGSTAWAQRLQVRLNFVPTNDTCSQESAVRPMVGTELVAGLIQSWQPALCQNGGSVYSFAATADDTNATELGSDAAGAAGMAFTTGAITFPDGGPAVLYTPVAITGLTFAFRIDTQSENAVQQIRQVKVNPELVAKSLTQSYKGDLPGGAISANSTYFEQPDWMKTVYVNITADPKWHDLNPDIARPGLSYTTAPMTTADESAVNQSVWAWVQSDQGTRDWLGGKPDATGMVVNSDLQDLDLDQPPPATGYPRDSKICTRSKDPSAPHSENPAADPCINSVDYIPFASNLDDVGLHIQRALTAGTPGTWDPAALSPSGDAGYWAKAQAAPVGQRFAWGITDAAVSAKYGLPTADLCTADGNCVAPSAASLGAAVAQARPDSHKLMQVDPANLGPDAYPLTRVVYAAVRLNQDPAALRDSAALLDYAADKGQVSGVEVGQLPPGYLPLPAGLRAATKAGATVLRMLADGKPVPSEPGVIQPSTPSHPSSTVTSPSHAATGVPDPGKPPTTGPVPTGATISQPPAGLAASTGSTANDTLGLIRWVLVGALIASGAGSLGGLLLRFMRRRRTVDG